MSFGFQGLEPDTSQFANAHLFKKVIGEELMEQIKADDDILPKYKILLITLLNHINTLYQRDESLAGSVKVLLSRV